MIEQITDNTVYFLQGELSNKYRFPFSYKDETFEHVEQAFMWEKAMYFKDTFTAGLILKRTNPKVIYDLGRNVEKFDQAAWDDVRLLIMFNILIAKFTTNETIQKILTDTAPKRIVYCDPYNNIWGIGLHWKDTMKEDPQNWKGQNLLGNVLESVRDRIIEPGENKLSGIFSNRLGGWSLHGLNE